MKTWPNLLSLSRIVLSLALIPLSDEVSLFLLIYLLCGLTDVLDGYLARRWHAESLFGARLDTWADAVMFGVALSVAALHIQADVLILIPGMALVAAVRILNLCLARIKYKTWLSVHTWGNKLTGFLVFALVFPILLWDFLMPIWIVLGVALLSALEETAMHLKFPTPDPNRRGLFF